MGPLKAPGKDGYQPIFFQRCWDIVGSSLTSFVIAACRNPSLIRSVNETLIVLIPKCKQPETPTQFRPISLCNVAYKTITKCLANRLKDLMPDLVHRSQTSFVPDRHITDNIIIVQEVVHSMHAKKGKQGSMLLKIDLAKAYDRIRWCFVKETLEMT
ncbi:Transposon TX1 uncharacterized 149 kDa protein [Linum perenne]